MFVEIRSEEYERGSLPRLRQAYREHASPAISSIIGAPLANYITLVGRINVLTQLWAHNTLSDYGSKHDALEQDSRWQRYLQQSQGILRYRNTRLTDCIVHPGQTPLQPEALAKPIVDFRTYLIHFDKMPVFLQTTRDHALKVMERHIGKPIGYFQTRTGNLQQITHLWGYESMADMEARRAARNADPEWQIYLDASDGIYEQQETQILQRIDL